jgi:hypothetical protein
MTTTKTKASTLLRRIKAECKRIGADVDICDGITRMIHIDAPVGQSWKSEGNHTIYGNYINSGESYGNIGEQRDAILQDMLDRVLQGLEPCEPDCPDCEADSEADSEADDD